MAVTKQTYTAVATWTPAQLANLFRDAFIDAGLMTAWHDSFTSGSIENRILRVEYDGTKAYGTTFYWFMFASNGAWLHVATGWNTTTKVPTGEQYLDFFATTTNSTANHWHLSGSISTSNTVELLRYTSGADPGQSWFVVKSGATSRAFTVTGAGQLLQPWLDLDKGFYSGLAHVLALCGNSRSAVISFDRGPALRRELTMGPALNGTTTPSHYVTTYQTPLINYGAPGHQANNVMSNYYGFFSWENTGATVLMERRLGAIILPTGFNSSNPAYSADSNPVFHSMPYSPYVVNPLPADMGLTFHYATNAFSIGDTLIVSPGVEEWEVLAFAANNSAVTGASPLFLARTV